MFGNWAHHFRTPSRRKRRSSEPASDEARYHEINLGESKNSVKIRQTSLKSENSLIHRAFANPRTIREWYLEIIACLGALAGLLAVAIFLSRYHKQRKPDWPAKITLNSVVSIFALMVKACMLYPISECRGRKTRSFPRVRTDQRLQVSASASGCGIKSPIRSPTSMYLTEQAEAPPAHSRCCSIHDLGKWETSVRKVRPLAVC